MRLEPTGNDSFDFLSDTDESPPVDLAAYMDMGDIEGARDIGEVMQEGSDEQKQEAQALSERI